MAKIDVGTFRYFYVTAPYHNDKFLCEMVDMLKLIASNTYNYVPTVLEVDFQTGKIKTSKVTKAEIVKMATNKKKELSETAFEKIMKNYK